MNDHAGCLNCNAGLPAFPGQCTTCGYINERVVDNTGATKLPKPAPITYIMNASRIAYPPVHMDVLAALNKKSKDAIMQYFNDPAMMTGKQHLLLRYIRNKDVAMLKGQQNDLGRLIDLVAFLQKFRWKR